MRTFFRLSTIFLAFVVAAPLSAQIAEIKIPGPDGLWGTADDTTTFVQRDTNLRFFNTEGPAWDLDAVRGTFSAVGKIITVPVTLNGQPFFIDATEQVELGINGEILHGPVNTAEFDRMEDANAIGDSPYLSFGSTSLSDLAATPGGGPLRSGATRPLFSTQEAFLATGFEGVTTRRTRDLAVYEAIRDNHFNLVEKALALPGIAANLPADFRPRAGLIDDGDGGVERIYPMQSGGTYKSAGHVYRDTTNGNEYLIPDTVNVVELSENTAAGEVTFVSYGDMATGTPDCFIIDGLLCMFNQDPRFPAEVFGAFEQTIPRSMFLDQMQGRGIDLVGYMVGDHVMYAMEIFTDLVNLDGVVEVSVERWRFRDGGNEIRFRGGVDEPTDITLVAIIQDANGATLEFNIPLAAAVDENGAPAPGAQFGARLEFDLVPTQNVAGITEVTLEARHPTLGVVSTKTFDRCEVDPGSCEGDG